MNINKYIPKNLKYSIKYIISDKKKFSNYKKEQKKIFIMLAADYGNLGDVAITEAQRNFLEENFKDYTVIEIPISETITSLKAMKNIINKDDIITIVGGGNLGNLYETIEESRRKVIKTFTKNKIISFPQTIDFSDDDGNKSLNKTIKIYSKHKNLHIFAREEKSYEKMKKIFDKNNVYICPDIVLYLNKKQNIDRNGIILCFREDKENYISKEDKQKLELALKDKYKNIEKYDTHVGDKKINESERKKYLQDIWSAFSTSKLVITDRLHGMIFCAITDTPCIVLPNSNYKIEQTYKNWIKNIKNNICLVEQYNKEEILEQIEKLMNNRETQKMDSFKEKYKVLIETIK